MKLLFFWISFYSVYSLDCINQPADFDCYDFQLTNASSLVNSLCESMPHMPGCVIQSTCQNEKGYCHPFSLFADICSFDMPKMKDCHLYSQLCKTAGSKIAQCTQNPPLPFLPTTFASKKEISSICSEMDMKGCEACRSGSCNSLQVYSDLCIAMPNMHQCQTWKSMCQTTPVLPKSLCGELSHKVDDDSMAAPTMKMFFHTGISDFILFETWVPTTTWNYLLGCFFCFLMALLYEFLLTFNAELEYQVWRETPSPTRSSFDGIDERDGLLSTEQQLRQPFRYLRSIVWTRNSIRLCRSLMRMITVAGAYVCMLLVMSFNVGLFLSVILGLGVGSYIWNERLDRIHAIEKEHCC